MTLARCTILIVDDDPGHIELIRRNLRRSGIRSEIVSLTSGGEALDYIHRRGKHAGHPPTTPIVLLDINMPGLNGIEVLRELKSNEATKSIPICMLTTTDSPEEINRCYAAGCNGYVTKPGTPEAFADAINRLGRFIDIAELPDLQPS